MASTRLRMILLAAAVSGCGPEEDTPRDHRAMGDDAVSIEQGLTVCPGPNTLPGIDISHYDGTINWTMVKGSGVQWAYAKATENLTYVDPTYATHWSAMKNAGVIRGAYHFFHPD